MHRKTFPRAAVALAVALAAALTACGGGGGGGTAQPAGGAAAAGKPDSITPLAVACANCSALDKNTYSGSGTGVWQASNGSTAAADFPVYIRGLTGQSVTLVLTNESADAVAMPSVRIESAAKPTYAPPPSQSVAGTAAAAEMAGIAEFNRSGFARYLDARKALAVAQKSLAPAAPLAVSAGYAVGDQRSIHLSNGQQRTVRLQTSRLTSDGNTVNVWIEPTELVAQRVTGDMVARVRDAFAGAGGIYDLLVRVGGPLWGPHTQEAYLIPGSGQPIDIFLVNFNQDGAPYGLMGYFWSLNNFRSDVLGDSNQSLGMYMDTETLYLDGERGFLQILSALAHEGTHMQNFYRRGVRMGADFSFDTWLEEMSAMMMEDWVSNSLSPGYNAIRELRFPNYLGYSGKGSYNCSVTDWTPMGLNCESYAVNGSFGAYLNRQFGLAFFRSLLDDSATPDSRALLDAAIQARRPDSGIGRELRYFSAAAAGLVPLDARIDGYSMPERAEDGLRLAGIDPAALSGSRRLPASVPSMLQPLASFPVSRSNIQGTFEETVRVPAGATLTVVIR